MVQRLREDRGRMQGRWNRVGGDGKRVGTLVSWPRERRWSQDLALTPDPNTCFQPREGSDLLTRICVSDFGFGPAGLPGPAQVWIVFLVK